ncbi:polysaccharide deacetylase family protein [Nonomuraea rhodomycinica]|uniref:Polysaccharide deacetylase family protein n=1 Tax=Nonomuraea rhodomycinica TaxID=1712872 RepID=A0A7Y6IWW3_9ACTN|nr:polysaccharide deacetylase family protein [Nonomuraea rhodomycinica]NUW45353.1 polysaccharide deacetylase family protein [Nonomuraea rhodomycinica]
MAARTAVAALTMAALTLGAGCGTRSTPPVAAPRPPVVADPGVLARRLAAVQPDWPARRVVDCRRRKCVALTFDDGPGPYTGKLLDLLRDRHVRATFFVLGEMVAADHAGFLRRMVEDGHELGNHTWSHPPLTAMSDERLRSELADTEAVVQRTTGVRMRLMRPPYGATDARVAEQARLEGLAQILWSVDTLDWRDRDPGIVARRAGAAPPGSIVLMHDIHPTSVAAVPRVLDTLASKGYRFVTVSELYGRAPLPGRTYTGVENPKER